MSLLLKHISLPLAPFTLDVDLEIHGRFTSIFGPSGSGKTSLLEVVAGTGWAEDDGETAMDFHIHIQREWCERQGNALEE